MVSGKFNGLDDTVAELSFGDHQQNGSRAFTRSAISQGIGDLAIEEFLALRS